MNKVLSLISAASLSLALSAASVAAADQSEKLKERIQPVGQLCMEGESCAAAPVVVASADGASRSAEEIYKSKCFSCHGTGAAGAPKLGNAGDWTGRISKGIDTLYTNAIKGLNGMPPKGLCMDCSDDELKATVDYLVENSK